MTRGERLHLRVAAVLDGLKAADVRVEFVARRSLPESDFERPALSSYGHKARDGLWSAMLSATGESEDGAAVFDRGRWWFIVLDSGYAHPRVLTYGELLTLHLEIASVKPLGGS